jgi:hypothetical protein
VGWIVSAVVALGIVTFIVGLLRRESRLSTIVALVGGLAIGLLILIVFRTPAPAERDALGAMQQGESGEAAGALETMDPEDAVSVTEAREPVPWYWTIIVGVPALVGLVLVLKPYLRRSPRKTTGELVQAAAQAADAIEAGVALSDAVQQCYRDMVVALERVSSVRRSQGMTPREFEKRLEERGLGSEDIRGLTRLFELCRYGAHTTTADDEQRAVAHLRRIAGALGTADG